jgi:hypothetical protein
MTSLYSHIDEMPLQPEFNNTSPAVASIRTCYPFGAPGVYRDNVRFYNFAQGANAASSGYNDYIRWCDLANNAVWTHTDHGHHARFPISPWGTSDNYIQLASRSEYLCRNDTDQTFVIGFSHEGTNVGSWGFALCGTSVPFLGVPLTWPTGKPCLIRFHLNTVGVLTWSWGGDVNGTSQIQVTDTDLSLGPFLFVLTVGSRGMEIWKDGILLASQAGHATVKWRIASIGFPTTYMYFPFFLAKGGNSQSSWIGGSNRDCQIFYFANYERELEREEIIALFDDPWNIIQRPTLVSDRHFFGPGGWTVTSDVIEGKANLETELVSEDTPQPEAITGKLLSEPPELIVSDSPQPEAIVAKGNVTGTLLGSTDSLEPGEIELKVALEGELDSSDTAQAGPIEAKLSMIKALLQSAASLTPAPIRGWFNMVKPQLIVVADVIIQPIAITAKWVMGFCRIFTEDDVYYSQKQRIHNALFTRFKTGPFIPVEYETEGANKGLMKDLGETSVDPDSLVVNDLTSSFIPAERAGDKTSWIAERGVWNWEVHIKFNGEVVTDIFEEALAEAPLVLARDTVNNLKQVYIEMRNVKYTHPVKHQSSSGTSAVYTFEAKFTRK